MEVPDLGRSSPWPIGRSGLSSIVMEVPVIGRSSPWPLGRSALSSILGISLVEVVHSCTLHHLGAVERRRQLLETQRGKSSCQDTVKENKVCIRPNQNLRKIAWTYYKVL
jgi:hypothetical protein